ncbi:protein quiver-like [Pomacea canaliculata]|uniref:protein quiver-like n=1 Tax=Pomacea canaliculata TaxID=400727 RepID=UPI000D72C2AC|nr:protein quiver-like [Pomacea canaliculata]
MASFSSLMSSWFSGGERSRRRRRSWLQRVCSGKITLVVVLLVLSVRATSEQNDYSNPIMCYTCRGTAVNSTCADPIDARTNPDLVKRECMNGVCLKWTKYIQGILHMIRTCSSDLNFHLTMIDGVCRTERNGNGYLCMCGKQLCNEASSLAGHVGLLAILLAAYSVIVQRLW